MAEKIKDVKARYVWVNASTFGNFRQVSGLTKTFTRRTDGGTNPHWRDDIKHLRNATCILSATYDEFISTPGYWYCTYGVGTGTNNPATDITRGHVAARDIPTPNAPDGSLVSVADARARSNFNKKLREFDSKFSGGVFAGELRETMDMLRHPARSLFEGMGKYLDSVKKRSRGIGNKPAPKGKKPKGQAEARAKAIGKIAAESWLEHAFGWVPFVNDINDAFEALDNLRDEDNIVKVSAGGYNEKDLGSTQSLGAEYGYNRSDRNIQAFQRCHVRYKGAINIKSDMTFASHAKNWGFHPSQFTATAWELLPWSFLADYFGNIGDILNYDGTMTSRLIWSCKGVKEENIVKMLASPNVGSTRAVAGSHYIDAGGTPSVAVYKRMKISRSVGPIPDLSFTDLNFELPSSDRHLLNIAALLGSANSINAQRFNRL